MRQVFLLFLLLLFAFRGFSQQENKTPCLPSEKLLIKHPIDYEAFRNFNFENQLKFDFKAADSLPRPQFFSSSQFITAIIAPDRHARQLGFFCKNELQLDKLTPVPVRFRLGSADYVNWMEQKPNALKPF